MKYLVYFLNQTKLKFGVTVTKIPYSVVHLDWSVYKFEIYNANLAWPFLYYILITSACKENTVQSIRNSEPEIRQALSFS